MSLHLSLGSLRNYPSCTIHRVSRDSSVVGDCGSDTSEESLTFEVARTPSLEILGNLQHRKRGASFVSEIEQNRHNKEWIQTKLLKLKSEACQLNLDVPSMVEIYKLMSSSPLSQELKDLFMFVAVQSDDPSLLEKVLASGANVFARDDLGRTPIHLAAEMDLVPMIEVLLKWKPDINAKVEDPDSQQNGETPLHVAVNEENDRIVAILLGAGADATVDDAKGQTPFRCSLSGSSAIFELFIAKVSTLLRVDSSGNSFLHNVVLHGSDSAVNSLIVRAKEAGVLEILLEMPNAKGETALVVASQDSERFFVAKLLIQNGANLGAVGHDGRTSLHWASFDGNEPLTRLLIERKVSLDVEDKDLLTPLHLAVCGFSWISLKVLIDAGAALNPLDNQNNSPLMLADLLRWFFSAYGERAYEVLGNEEMQEEGYHIPYIAFKIPVRKSVGMISYQLQEISKKLVNAGADFSMIQLKRDMEAVAKGVSHSPDEKDRKLPLADRFGAEIPFMEDLALSLKKRSPVGWLKV